MPPVFVEQSMYLNNPPLYLQKFHIMHIFYRLLVLLVISHWATAQTSPSRFIQPNDVYRLQQIQNAKLSPEGNWIMYSLSSVDSAKDKNSSKLYMVSWDGKETVCLTEQTQGVGSAQWSPDGKYISFVTSSKDDDNRQLFLMDRRGGEAFQLTKIKGELQSYNWSNDGKKIVFTIKDPATADTAKSKVRKPYEIDRFQFKQDYEGYLDNRKSHLYLFDVASKKLDTLTKGNKNEQDASFSADGNAVVYVSNITADPDRNSNSDIFLLDLTTKAPARQLTTFTGSNSSPMYSPDNQWIAFLQSTSAENYNMYDQSQLFILNVKTGVSTPLSANLDRPIVGMAWSADSKEMYTMVEDDRKQNIVKFGIDKSAQINVTNEEAVYGSINTGKSGKLITTYSNPNIPNEIYAWDNGTFRRLTHVQDKFVAPLKKIYVKGFQSISADKTVVSGILYTTEPDVKKQPLVLFIHGGPVAQDEYGFDLSRQVLAGAGFAVAAVNYRGSSGRGLAFCKAISADWGNKEVQDIIGAANYLIKIGVADSTKMAIAGWSYGGILTNYTIATDKRFKAAVSGAGSSLQFSIYGTDQYAKQYNEELGAPWKNIKKWMDLSYPFFKVEQIKTPTIFMASQNDFNVPVAGAEQMYQAFKTVGIPTELIIYPNQNHGVSVPSYIIHRFQKHIDWFKNYLK
jgi:dipeptidyl aminopeptidase/acylaminoacyl peptidase